MVLGSELRWFLAASCHILVLDFGLLTNREKKTKKDESDICVWLQLRVDQKVQRVDAVFVVASCIIAICIRRVA